MTAPPDPSIADDGDKCPNCGKPLSKHTYNEQKECFEKNDDEVKENEETNNDMKNEIDESDDEMIEDDEITGPTDNGRIGDSG